MKRKRSKVRSSRRASSKRRNNRNKRSSRLRKALESLPRHRRNYWNRGES